MYPTCACINVKADAHKIHKVYVDKENESDIASLSFIDLFIIYIWT